MSFAADSVQSPSAPNGVLDNAGNVYTHYRRPSLLQGAKSELEAVGVVHDANLSSRLQALLVKCSYAHVGVYMICNIGECVYVCIYVCIYIYIYI